MSSALTVVARFFLFVVGGVFVTLFLFSIVFDDFLEVNFTAGRSVTWWLGITGACVGSGTILDQSINLNASFSLQVLLSLSVAISSRMR